MLRALDDERVPRVPGEDGAADAVVQQRDDEQRREDPLVYVRCAACGHIISDTRARQRIGAAWEQHFVNPHGVLFRVGRFSRAPGALSAGSASTEFSWFPGYSWQIQICGGCYEHVGWLFRQVAGGGDRSQFYGLVVDRLREG